MVEFIMLGIKYGAMAAATAGAFAVGIAVLLPVVVLAWTIVGFVLKFGGR